MGYTTDFEGEFTITPALIQDHKKYLNQFSETRRMKRNIKELEGFADPIREAVGLPLGKEGEFFVGGGGMYGQDQDKSIIDYNEPSPSQPGLWCKWVPNEEGTAIIWNEMEKFYYYEEWLKYLIKNFLNPWGYKLNGEVKWMGEDPSDIGKLVVKNNVVKVKYGEIVYKDK